MQITRHAVALTALMASTGCPGLDPDPSENETTGAESTGSVSPGTTEAGTTGGSSTASESSDTGTGAGASESTGSGSDTMAVDDTSSDGTTGERPCLAPSELGVFVPEQGAAEGFDIDGSTLYLASTSAGVLAIDISDPSMPMQIGQYDFGSGTLAHRVAYAAGTVYVGLRGSGYAIVDATDPTALDLLAEDDTIEARDVAVAGSTLLVADNDGLLSYDVSNPAMPMPLTTDLVLPGATESVEVSGDVAFVASTGHGLSAVDISDPGALAELSSLSIGNGSSHLAVEGSIVYVSYADGLSIVDASNPAMMVEIGLYERERAWAVDTDLSTVFLTGRDTVSTQVPFLAVLDASDPGAVLELDTTNDAFDDPVWLRFSDGLLYASVEDDDGLHVLDACPTE
ncbi:MAG: hypothetical protein AAF799_10875 [Myxococcota bacterium]